MMLTPNGRFELNTKVSQLLLLSCAPIAQDLLTDGPIAVLDLY